MCLNAYKIELLLPVCCSGYGQGYISVFVYDIIVMEYKTKQKLFNESSRGGHALSPHGEKAYKDVSSKGGQALSPHGEKAYKDVEQQGWAGLKSPWRGGL